MTCVVFALLGTRLRCLLLFVASAGLLHLQTHKITHADMRLENILVAIDGRAIISNFGHAKRFKKRTMSTPYEAVRGPLGGAMHAWS